MVMMRYGSPAKTISSMRIAGSPAARVVVVTVVAVVVGAAVDVVVGSATTVVVGALETALVTVASDEVGGAVVGSASPPQDTARSMRTLISSRCMGKA